MNRKFKKLPYRACTKKELVKLMGMSERTVRYYLNVRYFEELKEKTDYFKRQKILMPKQVYYLDRILKLDFWELET